MAHWGIHFLIEYTFMKVYKHTTWLSIVDTEGVNSWKLRFICVVISFPANFDKVTFEISLISHLTHVFVLYTWSINGRFTHLDQSSLPPLGGVVHCISLAIINTQVYIPRTTPISQELFICPGNCFYIPVMTSMSWERISRMTQIWYEWMFYISGMTQISGLWLLYPGNYLCPGNYAYIMRVSPISREFLLYPGNFSYIPGISPISREFLLYPGNFSYILGIVPITW